MIDPAQAAQKALESYRERHSHTIPAASPEDVMRDQLEFLMESATVPESGCSCDTCVRYRAVKFLLFDSLFVVRP